MIKLSLSTLSLIRSGLSTLLLSAAGLLMSAPVLAQNIVEQQGTLAPMRDEYAFSGDAGESFTIELSSEEFDTVLFLVGPDGAEIDMNDDYGGTLNSTIVITLPADGEYKAVASSFSGQGGGYDLTIRPATEYELVYDRAIELMTSEDFGEAIEAYTAAIALDPNDPSAYLGRADAHWGRVYLAEGENFKGPESLTPGDKDAILADYDKAAELYEARGEADIATAIRDQAQALRTGETPLPDALEPQAEPEEPESQTPEPQ